MKVTKSKDSASSVIELRGDCRYEREVNKEIFSENIYENPQKWRFRKHAISETAYAVCNLDNKFPMMLRSTSRAVDPNFSRRFVSSFVALNFHIEKFSRRVERSPFLRKTRRSMVRSWLENLFAKVEADAPYQPHAATSSFSQQNYVFSGVIKSAQRNLFSFSG